MIRSVARSLLAKEFKKNKLIDSKSLTNNFKTLDKIFDADKDSLTKIFKDENFVNSLIQDLENLKEKILIGKRF